MSDEQYGFVFAVTFIIIFASLLATIPADLQGQGETGDIVTPVNPNLLSDFADSKEFDKTDFGGIVVISFTYELPVGGTTWECLSTTNYFYLGAHTLFVGLWLGGYSWCEFISDNGTNYGTTVTFSDIDNDIKEGAVRYTLQFEDTGQSAGGFVFYYNTTTYTDSSDAWDNNKLYLLHGIGIDASATANIGSLIISLLLLQLPDVPLLINVLLVTPIWACIIFVLWFIIKEMIPFV